MSVASYINYHRAPFTKFMSISEYNEKHQAHIPQNAEFETGFRAALADARRVTDPHDYVQHQFNVEEMKNTLRKFSGKLGGRRSSRQIKSQGGIGSSLIGKGTVPARPQPDSKPYQLPATAKKPARPSTPPFDGPPNPAPGGNAPGGNARRRSSSSSSTGSVTLSGPPAAVTPSAPSAAATPSAPGAPLSEEELKRLRVHEWQLRNIWFTNKGRIRKNVESASKQLNSIIKELVSERQYPVDIDERLDQLLKEAEAKLKPELKPVPGTLPEGPKGKPTGFMDSDEEEEVSPMDVEDTTLGVEDISLDDVLDEYGEEAEHYEEATTGVSSLHEEIDTYLKSNAKDDASFARDRAHVIHFNTVSTHLPARLMKGRDRYMKRLKAYLDGDMSAKVRMLDNTEVLVSALSPNADSLRALLKASSGEPRFCECT